MITDVVQRWTLGREHRRPAGEVIRTSAYDVAVIASAAIARAFVKFHHYAATASSTAHRFGLYLRGELAGVALFGPPASMAAHRAVWPGLTIAEAVTLGRFVLLDSVPGNGESWALYHGDAVEVMRQLPSASVDLAVYSPPFANLYTYSSSERDMGNCLDDAQFLAHYRFVAVELLRILRPGRIAAIHCKDLVNYKGRDGKAGLRDFPGDLIRVHQDVGFAYHSKVTVWKCPVTEMTKTKAHGLLYKTLRADSTFSRQGLAEYVVMVRKWSAGAEDDALVVPVTHTKESFPLPQWQEWASPVWFVDDKDVLNVQQARDDQDEKHMCPLALPIIERCVGLWSNPGNVVFSPFAGIGSEGYQALKMRRRFLGVELKDSYFASARRNLEDATRLAGQGDLFTSLEGAPSMAAPEGNV